MCNIYIGTHTHNIYELECTPTQSHLHFDGCFPVYGCMLVVVTVVRDV